MEGTRFSDRAYEDVMDVFRKIASATGESLETVCQMQEEERNNLKSVLGLQQEEGDVGKVPPRVGNKRKALQTFQEETSLKRFASDRGEMPELLTRSSRVAAKKANLKLSEINKFLKMTTQTQAMTQNHLLKTLMIRRKRMSSAVTSPTEN